MNPRTRWSGLPPWARWVTGIVIAVIALNVLLSLLRGVYTGPEGRPSSSYATAPDGIAALAELLARNGHPVVPLRGSLTESLPETGVLVVLDPVTMSNEEVGRLKAWVEGGGRLLIGGRPALWASDLLERPPTWTPLGARLATPLVDIPETAAVNSIEAEGFGAWAESGGALPVVGTSSESPRTVVSIASIGTGRAVLIADTSMLHNRYLAQADNAAFALNLAGNDSEPVYFAEGVHGYGNETGLAALPFRWKFALGGLALAALVWMVAVGRRLGPPEPEGRDLPPPRRAYVEALTTTLARTKQANEVVAPVRAEVRSRIARRVGLEHNADAQTLEGAGRTLGLTDDELAAVFGRSDHDVIAAGRALVKLGGREW